MFGNGTKDNRGRKLVINRRTAPSYDRVLDMLSKLIELPGGVRKLYTLPDCKLIKSLEMLSGCTNTDFVAVGNAALDRSKLHTLGAPGGGGGSATPPTSSAGGHNSAKGKGKSAASPSVSTPRGSAKSRKSSDLNKHKQLPGIAPAVESKGAGGKDEKENIEDGSGGSSNINTAKPLPGIDNGSTQEGELQSSTKLQPVGNMMLDGDHRPAGNADYVATELINAAGQADKALDEERDRQRRAHEERMATRQHARETEQTRKLEAYAEGAERVDTTIDEERARQKKEFQRKLSRRMRTNDKLGKGAKADTTVSLKEKEEKAATTIQAAYRGHKVRKDMSQIRKQAKKEKKPKGKKKKKKSKVKGGKGQSSPPPAEKATGAAAAADSAGPMTSKELLAVRRIPTPDLTITPGEIEGLQNAAATKIQAGFRGHISRKTTGPPPMMAARLLKEQTKKDAAKAKAKKAAAAANPPPAVSSVAEKKTTPPAPSSSDKAKEKKEKKEKKKKKKGEKGTKKKKKKGEAATSPETPASPGETQATKLERQTSRFSTKGIEERSKVEESYDIGKKIGDGNFAVVKECTKKETGEKFALKIIDKSKTRGAK